MTKDICTKKTESENYLLVRFWWRGNYFKLRCKMSPHANVENIGTPMKNI